MNNSTYIIMLYMYITCLQFDKYMNNYIRVHTMTQSELAYTYICTSCLQYIHANDKYMYNERH